MTFFFKNQFVLILLLTIGVFATISFSQAQTVGTTTADILKINQGTRPSAMGGVFTAMGDDVYSINYNPAGLSYIKATQVVVMHLDSLADIQYEYLAFGTAFGSSNVIGVNLTYRHMPPIDNQNNDPAGAVNSDDLLGSLSYACKLGDNLRAGLTFKYLKSTLAYYSASAVGFDIGAILDRLPYGIRIGAAVQNLGTGMTYTPGGSGSTSGYPSENLPMFLRFGLGTHQVIDGTKDLNVAVEVFKPADQDIKLGIGGEFWVFPELFAVRGGYKIENLGSPYGGYDYFNNAVPGVPNAFNNYTIGCTLTRRVDGDDFSVDIAYNPANFTSTTTDTFFFALNLKFNQLRIF